MPALDYLAYLRAPVRLRSALSCLLPLALFVISGASALAQSTIPDQPKVIQPADGATGVDPSQPIQVQWSTAATPQAYYLWVGSSVGMQNLYGSGETLSTTTSINVNPSQQVFLRLWLKRGGVWTYSDSTFSTDAGRARLSTPSSSAVSAANVHFQWNAIPDAKSYILNIGSTPGASDVVHFSTTGTWLYRNLQPNTTYYVRLITVKQNSQAFIDSVLSTVNQPILQQPVYGATDVDMTAPVQFQWSTAPNPQGYFLFVGTAPGASDGFHSNSTLGTTAAANLRPNTQYFTRLWLNQDGAWSYTDAQFTTGSSGARLIAPANGATVGAAVTFSWTPDPDALDYGVWLGTTPGQNDVASLFSNDTSVSTQLNPGTRYFVRLWTQRRTGWISSQSTFRTSAASLITAPTNGQTSVDPNQVAITWQAQASAQSFQLLLGSSPGGATLFDSGRVTATSANVRLPSNTVVYARLLTTAAGTTISSDSTFTTGTGAAHLTIADHATGVDLFPLLSWNLVADALQYALIVSPTGFGNYDGMATGSLVPTVSSRQSWGFMPSTKYYAEICTKKPAGWTCAQITFTTRGADPVPADQQAFYSQIGSYVAQVREMTNGLSNSAKPGTLLYQELVDHFVHPTSVDCGYYTWALMDLLGQNRIMTRRRDVTLIGQNGHVLSEFWDPFNQKWVAVDPTFGYVYYDAGKGIFNSVEDFSALLHQKSYPSMQPVYVSKYGADIAKQYFMDPITLFNDIEPITTQPNNVQEDSANSPLPYLTPVLDMLSQQGIYGTYIFSFQGAGDSISITTGGHTIQISPGAGLYSSFTTLSSWSFTGPIPSGMQMYIGKRILF